MLEGHIPLTKYLDTMARHAEAGAAFVRAACRFEELAERMGNDERAYLVAGVALADYRVLAAFTAAEEARDRLVRYVRTPHPATDHGYRRGDVCRATRTCERLKTPIPVRPLRQRRARLRSSKAGIRASHGEIFLGVDRALRDSSYVDRRDRAGACSTKSFADRYPRPGIIRRLECA